MVSMNVKRDVIRGMFVVSTVNLGAFGFETMVFQSNERGDIIHWREFDSRRYTTLADAEAGHADVVRHWYKMTR